MKPCHFFVSYNPLFNTKATAKTQAHEFYDELQTKKEMFWGKLKVSEFSEPLKFENYQQVFQENKSAGHDTYLYVSDYKQLWIGKVAGVYKEAPAEKTLSFYKGKSVEIWFKITQFDLISIDTTLTAAILNDLYIDNEYFPQKVKGMGQDKNGLRFPVIVQDTFERSHHMERDPNKVPVEHSAFPPSYVISEKNFQKLSSEVKCLILKAESLLVEVNSQGKKDRQKLEDATLSYLVALETILNDTFVAQLRTEEGSNVFVPSGAPLRFLRAPSDADKKNLRRLKDVHENFDLSQIKMLLSSPSFFSNVNLDNVFRNKKAFWEYCRLELRNTLKNEGLLELKAALSSGEAIKVHDRELLLVRNILLGIGGKGVFNAIIENYYESYFSHLHDSKKAA